MKTTDYIAVTIDRLPKGYVFTYADFTTETITGFGGALWAENNIIAYRLN